MVICDLTFSDPHDWHGPVGPRLWKSCEIVGENEESCDFFQNKQKLRKKVWSIIGKGLVESLASPITVLFNYIVGHGCVM